MYRQLEKKLVKHQYHLHMSSQYGGLRPTSGWDRLVSLGHGFHIMALLLHRHHSTEVNQTLHYVWQSPALVHYLYIFGGLCSLAEFCHVEDSLCVQVLRSPILAALLDGTRAVGVSQTLWRGTRNGITEFSLLVIFNRGRHLSSEGGHHVGHRPTFCLLQIISNKTGINFS